MVGRQPRFGGLSLLAALLGAGCATSVPEAATPAAASQRAPADTVSGVGKLPLRNPSAKERVALEAAFARADANGDGKLSRQEAALLPAIEARFDELDTDHDGMLSFDEFMIGALAVD